MGRKSGRLERRMGGRNPKSEIRKGYSAALVELTPGGSDATASGSFA
jgi:hypothetical protein